MSRPVFYCLDSGAVEYRSTQQSIPVIASAPTKVSCWIKTDSIINGSTRLQVLFYDSGGIAVGAATYLGNPGPTTDWTYYSATPTAPSTAATANHKVAVGRQ